MTGVFTSLQNTKTVQEGTKSFCNSVPRTTVTCLRQLQSDARDAMKCLPFSPSKWETTQLLHDPQGLIDLVGKETSFVNMLDSVSSPLFDESYYGQDSRNTNDSYE